MRVKSRNVADEQVSALLKEQLSEHAITSSERAR